VRHPLLVASLFILCHTAYAADKSKAPDSTTSARMDSVELRMQDVEQKVRSTLMFGGSSPVSFSGEARLKLQYHNLAYYPSFMKLDRTWLQSGYEGNESFLRLAMVVRAGRNTVLWSKIGFQHTLPGNYTVTSSEPVDTLAQYRHDKADNPTTIHEDMCAGIAVRTVPASFWLKMGNVQWIEASPLTIWKAQPRTFAWEYLPFEVEQPIGRYYEYNIAKGEKTGRAAWNKKPFNGINLESINLPLGLYVDFLYGSFQRFDNFEREYIDFSNDLAYAGDSWPLKGIGIGDSYRHVLHGRIAAQQALFGLTPGINFVRINYDDDIASNPLFQKAFSHDYLILPGAIKGRGYSFYKEPYTLSTDLRGDVNDKLRLHLDLGFSRVDTTFFSYDTIMAGDTIARLRQSRPSPFAPAFYSRINSEYGLPIQLDLAYFSPDFYSPFSFALPMDCFYPFGANLLGPGKFAAGGEASPYSKNLAGANLTVAPKLPGYGHLKITYGQHFQLTKSQDAIFFPYRLNGQDLFSLFQSSYNRWGNDPIDVSIKSGKYNKRLGDESYTFYSNLNPPGPTAGGMRSDFMGMFEGFVPYESAAQADSNLNEKTTILTRSKWVPSHRKFTSNLELDASYDVGPLVGYKKDLFVSCYAALNGVSTSFSALAFDDKPNDMLLWGAYLRFEPAIALTEKLYVLGLAGFENWRSQKSFMEDPEQKKRSIASPIDYFDAAYGLGFDWEMLSRTGLHARAKWMKHEDKAFPGNNWETPVFSMEIKMWF
jgi:hypothetical protein